jgi:hypothetical protein
MTHHNIPEDTHEHPWQMNRRGRIVLGTAAVAILGGAVGGVAATNANAKHEAPTTSLLIEEQKFDSQIADAIEKGPGPDSNILGKFAVGQDRTVANAMIQEANKLHRPTDIHERNDLLSITLSSNAFDADHQPSYQPDDIFVLFEQDVNGDGKNELLATSADDEK